MSLLACGRSAAGKAVLVAAQFGYDTKQAFETTVAILEMNFSLCRGGITSRSSLATRFVFDNVDHVRNSIAETNIVRPPWRQRRHVSPMSPR